jgi:hypothetical protein
VDVRVKVQCCTLCSLLDWYILIQTMTNDESVVVCRLVATSLTATRHLDSVLERSVVGGGGVAHLSSSLPVFVHGWLPLFVSRGGLSSSFVCCLINSVDDVSSLSGRPSTSMGRARSSFVVPMCSLWLSFVRWAGGVACPCYCCCWGVRWRLSAVGSRRLPVVV